MFGCIKIGVNILERIESFLNINLVLLLRVFSNQWFKENENLRLWWQTRSELFFLKTWNSAQVHLFVDFNVFRVLYQLRIGTAKKETFMERKFCSLAWNFSRNKGLHFQHIRELTLLWVI